MKNQTILSGVVAIAMGLFAAHANAEGFLGKNYVSLDGTHEEVSVRGVPAHLDAWSATLGLNYVLLPDNGSFGVDFVGAISWGEDAEDFLDVSQHSIGAGLKLHRALADNLRGFVGAGLGYSWIDDGGYEDDTYGIVASVGLEYVLAEKWVITPSASYSDRPDYHAASQWTYSLEVAYWITESISVAGEYSYVDARHGVSSDLYSLGARYRF